MSMYYEGYQKAREVVEAMSHEKRLQYIDDLFGRDNLEDESDEEAVRYEALDQCRREFTDESSKEYRDVQFWVGLAKLESASKARWSVAEE